MAIEELFSLRPIIPIHNQSRIRGHDVQFPRHLPHLLLLSLPLHLGLCLLSWTSWSRRRYKHKYSMEYIIFFHDDNCNVQCRTPSLPPYCRIAPRTTSMGTDRTLLVLGCHLISKPHFVMSSSGGACWSADESTRWAGRDCALLVVATLSLVACQTSLCRPTYGTSHHS